MQRRTTIKGRFGVLLLSIVALALLAAPHAGAAPVLRPYDAAAQKAATWVLGQQQAGGGFPGFGVGSAADAIIGLKAAGLHANPAAGGTGAVAFLATNAATYAKSPGAAAKLLLAIAAAGTQADGHSFGGVDLWKVINDSYDPGSGHYGKDVTGQALAILATTTWSQPVPPAALEWLRAAQSTEGGWSFDGSTGPGSGDSNTTGLALQALAGANGLTPAVAGRAFAYLHAQQNPDGGYAYQQGPGNDSDANSTAMVIMGLAAAGEDPNGAAWQKQGKSPLAYLAGLQNASGALRYQAAQPEDNPGATYQAIPALAGMILPGPRAAGAAGPGPGMPTTGLGTDGAVPLAAVCAALLLLAGLRIRAGVPRQQ
ncbi:MAG TPA: prenyltransferase/squalene oxidase repeat-containing protein [Chloroflexia bacterium]|nr:prenyltransferase/squalene oxidase repeat-containing protein [Chloroflexia bacterium]